MCSMFQPLECVDKLPHKTFTVQLCGQTPCLSALHVTVADQSFFTFPLNRLTQTSSQGRFSFSNHDSRGNKHVGHQISFSDVFPELSAQQLSVGRSPTLLLMKLMVCFSGRLDWYHSNYCKQRNNNTPLLCAFLEMFCKNVSGREMECPEITVGRQLCANTEHMLENEFWKPELAAPCHVFIESLVLINNPINPPDMMYDINYRTCTSSVLAGHLLTVLSKNPAAWYSFVLFPVWKENLLNLPNKSAWIKFTAAVLHFKFSLLYIWLCFWATQCTTVTHTSL